jgi:hypothetical protein
MRFWKWMNLYHLLKNKEPKESAVFLMFGYRLVYLE